MPEGTLKEKKRGLFPLTLFASMLFILWHADSCRADLFGGLLLCAKNVIPSLFPHLVLSELFVSGLSFSERTTYLSRFFTHIFRLPSSALPVILVGSICGFPVGARLAARFYQNGFLAKEDAELLSAYANNTSPAFVISGVGAALFGSVKIGLFFFVSEIAASLLCLLFSARFRKKTKNEQRNHPSCAPTTFVEAVRNASSSMVSICGFVLFFSLITGIFCRTFSPLSLPFSALFEVTNACKQASLCLLDAPKAAFFFAAFSIGFGGLCAAMQTKLCMKESGLYFKLYLPRKLLEGFLSVFFFFLLTEGVGI